MTKKSIIRSLAITVIIAAALWPLRFVIMIFLWLQYGEGEQGSIEADKIYQLFPVHHFPIVLPMVLLIFQSVKFKLWSNDMEKQKSNIVAALGGLIIYFLFEKFEIFVGS